MHASFDTALAIPAVRFAGVARHFGAVKAVDGVDLSILPGEFFAMLGPSGSGKTTCLRLIAGFEQPDAGHIEIFGEKVEGLPPYRRAVNTVFQDYALFPHLSVGDNVAYGLRVRGVGRAERDKQAREALAMVKLAGMETRRPAQLSGGQRQRVALARALIVRPKVLLLDEPLGALDLKLREEMQLELKGLQRALGLSFVFVTHDQGEALSMADRVAVFNEGRIVQVGPPEEVYERPRTRFVAGFVGSANVLSAAEARSAWCPGPSVEPAAGEDRPDVGGCLGTGRYGRARRRHRRRLIPGPGAPHHRPHARRPRAGRGRAGGTSRGDRARRAGEVRSAV